MRTRLRQRDRPASRCGIHPRLNELPPMSNDIVGHKTKRDPVTGELYHEPIRQDEAATILAACDAEDKRMAELMPTEQSAIEAMFSAWARLKQLGWREACYCPKDRSTFLAIEPGSTGIFNCIYEGE